MHRSFANAAILATMVALSARAADGPVTLTFDPPAGTKLQYRLDTEIEANMQGAVFTTTLAADAEVSRLEDAKNGNLVLQILYQKVEGATRMGDNLEPINLKLDGRSVQAEVTRRGVLVKAEPTATDVPAADKEMLADLTDAFFVQLPEKPVKVGETWKQDLVSLKAGETGSGEFTFEETVKKEGIECALLLGNVTAKKAEPPLEGTGKVETHIAITGGYVVALKGSMNMQGAGPNAVQSFELKLKPAQRP